MINASIILVIAVAVIYTALNLRSIVEDVITWRMRKVDLFHKKWELAELMFLWRELNIECCTMEDRVALMDRQKLTLSRLNYSRILGKDCAMSLFLTNDEKYREEVRFYIRSMHILENKVVDGGLSLPSNNHAEDGTELPSMSAGYLEYYSDVLALVGIDSSKI